MLLPVMTPSRNQEGGSLGPAVLLALLLITLVGITVFLFASHAYPPPPAITAEGRLTDQQYARTLWATGAIFVLAQLALAYAAVRFRERGRPARFIRGNNVLEIAWTSATVLLFIGLSVLGRRAWADTRLAAAPADAVQIEVTTTQFAYTFRYPGPDGKFGRLDPNLVSAATGNPLGLDPNDAAGTDDIVVPVLTVPIDRPVELLVRSQDVVHNFFVRELRLQQDAVPGMLIPMHFTADRAGRYEIVCTQLCGQGHNAMRSFLNVVSEPEYENFLKQQGAAR
jgi:cytochrome c oxidase subunit II